MNRWHDVVSRWAKVLMMVQSSISLTTLAIVAARAVNTLGDEITSSVSVPMSENRVVQMNNLADEIKKGLKIGDGGGGWGGGIEGDRQRSAFGSVRRTSSPLFHVRVSSTYEPGFGTSFTALPLSRTTKPSAAQDGRRSARVNVFGARTVSTSAADSPSGNVVAMSSVTPASAHFAVEGAYRFTHNRSPDSY
jgi:hypothetical protein